MNTQLKQYVTFLVRILQLNPAINAINGQRRNPNKEVHYGSTFKIKSQDIDIVRDEHGTPKMFPTSTSASRYAVEELYLDWIVVEI